MAKSVNKVFLLGHVGKDPELRSTNGGTLVANLSLATTDRFKDSSGNWMDRAEWHDLVAFSRGAEILRDYVKKGSRLYIEGWLTTRSWDDKDSGEKRYRTEVIVNNITLLGPNENGSSHNGNGRGAQSNSRSQGRSDRHSDADEDYSGLEITDQDIPF